MKGNNVKNVPDYACSTADGDCLEATDGIRNKPSYYLKRQRPLIDVAVKKKNPTAARLRREIEHKGEFIGRFIRDANVCQDSSQ